MKNDKNRKHFVDKVTEKFSDRSYYTRHHKSRNAFEYTSYVLSILSIFAGFTALYKIFMTLTGVNDTLLNSLKSNIVLSLIAFCIAIPLLYFLERLKHGFHIDGLQEKFLVTDDLGKLERNVGVFLSVVSICLSGAGGYLIANEIAGVDDQKTIVAISAKYDTKKESLNKSINSLDTSIINIDNEIAAYKTDSKYQNGKGQILYKWIEKIGNLESDKTSFVAQKAKKESELTAIEDDIKNEQQQAGVYDKIGLFMNSKATQLTILFMILGQLIVDILLYVCLRFIVFFEFKVAQEEGDINKQSISTYIENESILDSEMMVNRSPVYNRNEVDFNIPIPNSTQTTNKQQIEKTKSFATHKTQSKQVFIVNDYKHVRNNMKNNYSRLVSSYTETRFNNVKDGIEKFCSWGLKCWIDNDNKLQAEKLEDGGTLQKDNVTVSWNDESKLLTIKYY